MFLNGVAQKLQLITDTASDVEVVLDYAEVTSAGAVSGAPSHLASITTATTTDIIIGSATAGTTRKLKHLNAHNNHASQTVICRWVRTDGTNTDEVIQMTLLVGETITYNGDTGKWTHFNANGAEYTNVTAYVDRLLGISGTIAETIPRELCAETNTAAPTASGTLFLMGIFLRAGQVVSNISFFSATTAAGTPTNGFFALYDGSRNLLAQSANFTTEAWAANTIKTKAMSAAYTVPTTGLYYIGIMITATTIPTLKGNTARTGGQLASTAPIIAGASSSGLTTSLPNPAAAITANSLLTVWAAVS